MAEQQTTRSEDGPSVAADGYVDDPDLGSPYYWYKRERESGTLGTAGPVDIYWIDDNDGCGPRKLSRPIKCF